MSYAVAMVASETAPDRASNAVDADALDVTRFQEGNQEAFESLVRRREREVYLVCRRMLGDEDEAMEAAQESFLRAFRSLGRFRQEATFRTWLFGIAMNVCRNRLSSASMRMKRRSESVDRGRDEGEDEPVIELTDGNPNPESATLGRELRDALEEALLHISSGHREILLLRQVHSMEYDEMAVVLGCRVGTVKSRLSRAREALRTALKGIWP